MSERQSRVGSVRIQELGICAALAIFLFALLFPVGSVARPPAQRRSCEWNLMQISHALSMYADDSDGRLPPLASSAGGVPCTLPFLLAAPYLSPKVNGDVWHCPNDRKSTDTFDGTPADWSVSYGYNWLGLTRNGKPLRLSEIQNPAETLAFVETDTYLATPRALLGQYGGSPPAYRHQGIAAAAFLDGRVRGMKQEELEPKTPVGSPPPAIWHLPSP